MLILFQKMQIYVGSHIPPPRDRSWYYKIRFFDIFMRPSVYGPPPPPLKTKFKVHTRVKRPYY